MIQNDKLIKHTPSYLLATHWFLVLSAFLVNIERQELGQIMTLGHV